MNTKYQAWELSTSQKMLKQKVKVFRIKIKRYEERCFHLNKTVCLERVRNCSMAK